MSITKEAKKVFEEALDDDLDMPVALASIFKFIREINKYLETNQISEENKSDIIDYFETIDKILGILSDKTIEFDDDVFYFTLIRNPYNRLASHYYQWKNYGII